MIEVSWLHSSSALDADGEVQQFIALRYLRDDKIPSRVLFSGSCSSRQPFSSSIALCPSRSFHLLSLDDGIQLCIYLKCIVYRFTLSLWFDSYILGSQHPLNGYIDF